MNRKFNIEKKTNINQKSYQLVNPDYWLLLFLLSRGSKGFTPSKTTYRSTRPRRGFQYPLNWLLCLVNNHKFKTWIENSILKRKLTLIKNPISWLIRIIGYSFSWLLSKILNIEKLKRKKIRLENSIILPSPLKRRAMEYVVMFFSFTRARVIN